MPVTLLPFGAWNPGSRDIDGSELDTADGVLPLYGGYRLWPQLSAIASVAAGPVTGAHAHLATATQSVQYGRPSADTSTGNWVNGADDTASLYTEVDEATADDSDYIVVSGAPSADTCKLQLSTTTDPAVGTGHKIRFRYRIQGSTGAWTLDLNLLEDTTERADVNASGSADVDWTEAEVTLSTAEANAITDYSDLFFTIDATVAGSVQYARPDDDLGGSWWQKSDLSTLAETTDGYTEIDETVASTSDFVKAASRGPSGKVDTFTFGLSSVTDPHLSSGHTVRYRAKSLNDSETFDVELLQGHSTVIASWQHTNLSSSWTTYTQSLTSGEADSITDYTDLRVRFKQTTTDASNTEQISVAWFEFEVPSAARAEVSWCEFECPSASSNDTPDNVTIYAGTDLAIYTVAQSGWTNVSKGGGYHTGSTTPYSWDACSYGEHVIFTDRDTAVQWDEDAGGAFADLITSTQKPKSRFCAVVREHLVLGDISYSPDGASDMVWWSALGDPQDFDFTAGDSTLSGRRRLRSFPGGITALIGSESSFLAFKRGAIMRGDWIGSPYVFNTYTASVGYGTAYPKSVVQDGMDVYFFGADGLPYVIRNAWFPGPVNVEPLHHVELAKYLQDVEFETRAIAQDEGDGVRSQDATIVGGKDLRAGLLMWAYRKIGETTDYKNDLVLVYDPRRRHFTMLEDSSLNIAAFCPVPNVQTEATSLLKGSRVFSWDGTNSTMGGFTSATTYQATLTTKIMTGSGLQGQQQNVNIHRIRPVFRAEPNATADLSLTVTVDYGDNLQMRTADFSTATAAGERDDGWYDVGPIDCAAFRVKVVVASAAGVTVKDIIGVQVEWSSAGRSNASPV